jgi:hypothetical protein
MKYFKRSIFAAFALSTSALFGGSITVGVNNGGNTAPFSAVGTRYQEAYASSLFSSPIAITGIDFFRSTVGPLGTGTYQLSLSTIAGPVNSLSNVNFNGNLGPNNATFSVMTLSGAAPSVLSFSGGPFNYNPAQGNLLLDIQITNNGANGNATFEDGDSGGPSTIERYQNFADSNVGFGLVTEFDFGSVSSAPEPGTFVLLGVGLFGIAGWRFRRVWGPAGA